MMRFVLLCVAVFGATASVARAEGMLPGGAEIQWRDVFISSGGTFGRPATPDDLRRYLNLAHCVCSQQNAGTETTIQYDLAITQATGANRPGEIWVGAGCNDAVTRAMNCRQITSQTIADIDTLITPDRIELSLYDVLNAPETMGACPEREGTAAAWVLVDSDGNSQYDYFQPQNIGTTADVGGFDTQPPPLPTEFTADPGEGTITVSWEPIEGTGDDVYAYQALCVGPGGAPVRDDPPAALYQTTTQLCGLAQDFAVDVSTIESETGSDVAEAPAPFRALDTAYVCGEVIGGTATSLTIAGLENGQEYTIGVVAVDLYGNARATYLSRTVAPQAVTDFWEDLHDRGSKVEGGCLSVTAGTFGPLALVVFGVVVVGLRRRRRAAGALVIAALVVVPAAVRADDFAPYWDVEDQQARMLDDNVTWHAGIRVGPYVPEIDLQHGLNAITGKGPYEAMFGEKRVWQILPMIDVDRIVWTGFGQLGFGGSIGYMQKSANAYLNGTSEDDPDRPRADGAKNTFRLLPLAATVTYRFTWLDDQYGIPVVPYVRGGLSYYAWWLRAPNGNLSHVCKNDAMPPCGDDNDNPSKGASFGFQGSVGITIRAERLDADAAMSMRNSGLMHAGFYAELQYAKVDGFGSETKLSVGDNTWFAGVDFEF